MIVAESPNPFERETGTRICEDCGSKRWWLWPRDASEKARGLATICASCKGLWDPDGPMKWQAMPGYPEVGYRLLRHPQHEGIPATHEYASKEWKFPDIIAETELAPGVIVRTCAMEKPSKHGWFYATYYVNTSKGIRRVMGAERVRREAERVHNVHVRHAEAKRAKLA